MFLTAVKPLNSLQRSRVSVTKSSVIPEARPAVLPVRGPKSPPCYIVVRLRNRWHVSDRKSVVLGKSESVRVDLGVCRIMTNKNNNHTNDKIGEIARRQTNRGYCKTIRNTNI